MPGNDFPGEQIHDNAQVIPSAASPEVSDIAGPYKIGSFLGKIPAEVVGTFAIVVMLPVSRRL